MANSKSALKRRGSLLTDIRRFSFFIPHLSAFLLALLAGTLLFNAAFIGGLTSMIAAFGIDELRTVLIAALIMSAGAALIGAAGGRRKLGAILGAGCVFYFSYLVGFIQLQLQPAHDPLGNVEPLNVGTLLHTSFVLTALALLSAFIGSAIGIALSEVLLNPLYNLARFIQLRYAHNKHKTPTPLPQPDNSSSLRKETQNVRTLLTSWLGVFALIILLVLASNAVDLFIYSPDVGIHLPPTIRSVHGQTHGKGTQVHNTPTHGTIVHDVVISKALGGLQKDFLVYLPPSYNTAQGQTQRYPTLYLLHGSPGKDSDWFTGGKADQAADTLIALGKIPELIMILPDGNGRPGQTSEWGNSFDQQQKMETYLATDLVNYVDGKYRTLADAAHRCIAGLSMGGFGAMNIAVHHPDIFGYVSSLGGYYRAEGSIWGNNTAYMSMNSPIDVLPNDKQAWHLHMFIGAATKDQPYYTDAQQFVQELGKLHLPYQLDIENGSHSWQVWQLQMYHTLLWLTWGN